MRTIGTLMLGVALGAGVVAAGSQDGDRLADTATRDVEGRYDLGRVRRWGSVAVASGHGRMVYRNGGGSTRVSEYDSVNVFETA